MKSPDILKPARKILTVSPTTAIRWCFGLAILCILLGFIPVYVRFGYIDEPHAETLGQLGDYLNGTVMPFWSLASILMILVGFFNQQRELQNQQAEISGQRQSYDNNRFQTRFFQFLEHHQRLIESARCNTQTPQSHQTITKIGIEAVKHQAERLFHKINETNAADQSTPAITLEHVTKVLQERQRIYPWIRQLNGFTFKLIEMTENSPVSNPKEYIDMFRSTFTPEQQYLLLMHALWKKSTGNSEALEMAKRYDLFSEVNDFRPDIEDKYINLT